MHIGKIVKQQLVGWEPAVVIVMCGMSRKLNEKRCIVRRVLEDTFLELFILIYFKAQSSLIVHGYLGWLQDSEGLKFRMGSVSFLFWPRIYVALYILNSLLHINTSF